MPRYAGEGLRGRDSVLGPQQSRRSAPVAGRQGTLLTGTVYDGEHEVRTFETPIASDTDLMEAARPHLFPPYTCVVYRGPTGVLIARVSLLREGVLSIWRRHATGLQTIPGRW